MEGAQWNTEALGQEKQDLAESLLKKLKEDWASGGFLHYGQGKWYPGESLPRWALGCYWRKDGKPIWQDERWLADIAKDYGFGISEAEKFIKTLADTLKVSRDYIRESYEDILHYLQKEQQLPINVEPSDPKLDDAEERKRMVAKIPKPDHSLIRLWCQKTPIMRRFPQRISLVTIGNQFLMH
jgi:uncharacterized protein (DUF2126 family)